jgi:hypothetical protein
VRDDPPPHYRPDVPMVGGMDRSVVQAAPMSDDRALVQLAPAKRDGPPPPVSDYRPDVPMVGGMDRSAVQAAPMSDDRALPVQLALAKSEE